MDVRLEREWVFFFFPSAEGSGRARRSPLTTFALLRDYAARGNGLKNIRDV